MTDRESSPPPAKPDIPLDAWVPYWTLESALPEVDRLGSMRDVSPFWFNAVGVDQIVVDAHADAELTASFMDELKGSTANVVPSIVDALGAGEMAALLADPTSRAAHVDAIARFAADGSVILERRGTGPDEASALPRAVSVLRSRRQAVLPVVSAQR